MDKYESIAGLETMNYFGQRMKFVLYFPAGSG